MAIRHKSPEEDERTAIAPYNFVTLPAEVVQGDDAASRSQDRYRGHSGRFECTLRTWSPVYIRGMMSAAEYRDYGHKAFADLTEAQKDARAKFFADPARRPQIPASSLRGMVRNIFEIVTHSKFTRVTNRRLAFRSFGKDNLRDIYQRRLTQASQKQELPFKAGYIRRRGGEWGIQPAQTFDGVSFCRVKHTQLEPIKAQLTTVAGVSNARWIYVKPGNYVLKGKARTKMAWAAGVAAKPSSEYVKGAWVTTGTMKGKKSDAIVYPVDEKTEWLPLVYKIKRKIGGQIIEQEIDVVADYLNQVSQEQHNLLGDDNGALREGQPVFYILSDPEPGSKKRQVLFFGHTMMMRLLYAHSPRDLVPANLRDDTVLDITDAVFGFVRDRHIDVQQDRQTRSGRVAFTPGVLIGAADKHLNQQPITPQILSSPKPTTFQHYLAQDNPDFNKSLRTYEDAESALRGHKLYWHKGHVPIEKLKAKDTTHVTQLTRITPLRDNAEFRFQVTFENLTDVELGALAWVMQLAGGNSERRFTLGMGKALGMGAVSIDAKLCIVDRGRRYEVLMNDVGWQMGEVDEASAAATGEQAKAIFEQEVLKRASLNPVRAAKLTDLPRIRELLHMMAWPGPDSSETRYMEIEHGQRKQNEYINRPVLPSALNIQLRKPPASKPSDTKPPPPLKTEPEQKHPSTSSSTQPPPVRPPPPPPPPPPPKQTDDIVTVTVLRIDAGSIVCQVPGEKVVGKLPLAEWRSGPKPVANTPLRVRVLGKNQASEFKLTLKGVK